MLTTDRLFSRIAIVFGAAIATAAVPAHANSSSAAAVDVTDAVEEAQSPLGNGDAQFRQLFASWERMDKVSAGVATPSVSVPSAMPLTDARLSSGYGMRNHPVLGGMRGHKGVDLAAPTGTPIRATGDALVHFHVSDNDRGVPGSGHFDFEHCATALSDIGYDGWITAEMFVMPSNPNSADVKVWRAIEPDPTEAARQTLDFMQRVFAR